MMKFIRITKDGGKQPSAFPPKGLSWGWFLLSFLFDLLFIHNESGDLQRWSYMRHITMPTCTCCRHFVVHHQYSIRELEPDQVRLLCVLSMK
jgi:hypothetical protein